jgi:hypothetical protein
MSILYILKISTKECSTKGCSRDDVILAMADQPIFVQVAADKMFKELKTLLMNPIAADVFLTNPKVRAACKKKESFRRLRRRF